MSSASAPRIPTAKIPECQPHIEKGLHPNELVAQLSEVLKVRPEQLPERVDDLLDRLRTAEKEIEKVRLQQLLAAVLDQLPSAVGGRQDRCGRAGRGGRPGDRSA